MSRPATLLFRLAILAFPSEFRREYGADLLRSIDDQHRFGTDPSWRIFVRELTDVAVSAPRMRGASPMTRIVIALVGTVVAVVAALAIGPPALAVVVVATVALLVGVGSREPALDHAASRRQAVGWGLAAVVAFGAAAAIPAADGGELSEPAWTAMAALGVVGLALAGYAVVIVSRPSHRAAAG